MSSWDKIASRNRRLNPDLYANPTRTKVLGSTPVWRYAKQSDTSQNNYDVSSLRVPYRNYDTLRNAAIAGDERAIRGLTNLVLSM